MHRPPPLPPGRINAPIRNQQEKSLPPEPLHRELDVGSKPEAASVKVSRGESEDSESSDTDYSSDFVSGAFWEINRKTPVPSARRAVLPQKSSSGSSSAAAVETTCSQSVMTSSCPPDGRGTDAAGAINFEELDEGYSDLAMVNSLRKPKTADQVTRNRNQYAKVMKKSALAYVPNSQDGVDRRRGNSPTGHAGDVGPEVDMTESVCGESPMQRTASIHSEDANGATRSEGDPGSCQPPENFYTPFPAHNNSPLTSASQAIDGSEEQCADRTLLKSVAAQSQQTTSSAALQSDGLEEDSVYACASEASSLPMNSVPPLPRRQDSLPSWKGDNSSDTPNGSMAAAAANGTSALGASKAEGVINKPIPARRKTFHPTSSSQALSRTRNPDKTFISATDIPPLPPRRGVLSCGRSVDSTAIDGPPPLPARKVQSFRSPRPMTAPPFSASESVTDQTSGSPGTGEESDQTFDHHSASVFHQVQCFSQVSVFVCVHVRKGLG